MYKFIVISLIIFSFMKTRQSRRDIPEDICHRSSWSYSTFTVRLQNNRQSSFCTSPATADPKSFGIGLQLYTIRDAMGTDVTGSLKKVSDIGYKYLELAGYANGKFYGYEPADFRKLVNDLGMEILSSHTQVEA